nr:MAG TPA: hypothetical protein [Caudoviricetes sp.]
MVRVIGFPHIDNPLPFQHSPINRIAFSSNTQPASF